MFSGPGRRVTESVREAFSLLREKPSLFLPKILSSLAGSLWVISFLEGYGSLLFYLISIPLLTFMGLSVTVVLAGAVKTGSLRGGVKEAADSIVQVLVITLLLIISMFLIMVPLTAGILLFLFGWSFIFLLIGLLLTVILAVVVGFSTYFIPVTLLDSGTMSAIKKSGGEAKKNTFEVGLLLFLSVALLIVAFVSSGALEKLGYLGFVLGRLLSAIFTTYAYTVSPTYYLGGD